MNKLLIICAILLVPCCGWSGTTYVVPSSGGGASTTATSGDFLSAGSSTTWTLTDWVDAGSIGGLTTVKRALLDQGGIVIKPKTKANDTTASGARSQGALTSVAAGDFVRGFRIGISTPSKLINEALGDTIEFGAAFVDGANVGTSSWYGVVGELSSGAGWYSQPTIYKMSNTAGSNRWDTAASYTSLASGVSPLTHTYDIWFVRSGTTLKAYVSLPGGSPLTAATWSVSADAGLAGIRFQMWGESAANTYFVTCTLNYSSTDSNLPWEI